MQSVFEHSPIVGEIIQAFLMDHNTIQIQRIFKGFHLIVDQTGQWSCRELNKRHLVR